MATFAMDNQLDMLIKLNAEGLETEDNLKANQDGQKYEGSDFWPFSIFKVVRRLQVQPRCCRLSQTSLHIVFHLLHK